MKRPLVGRYRFDARSRCAPYPPARRRTTRARARRAPSRGRVRQGSSDYATVYPTSFAPEPIPEYRPAPPGYGYMWVDGYWDWNGYDWTWSSGYWVPERVGYAYIGPRYVYVDGRPVYYRGYWQGDNGYREYGYGG